jgi:hypothetical protein
VDRPWNLTIVSAGGATAKTPIRRSLICDMTRPISLSKRIHDDMPYFIGFLGSFFADVRLARRVG